MARFARLAITKLLDMIVCDGRSLYTASMINSRTIALFVSGAAFALVVVLSCNSRSPITTIDANVADASSLDVAVPESCCSNITVTRSEEHTSELQSRLHLVCRLLLEK